MDRNPWALGEGVFHPLYRYSCQHSHFQPLQPPLRGTFNATGTLPYHTIKDGIYGFGGMLEPRYIYGADNLDQ